VSGWRCPSTVVGYGDKKKKKRANCNPGDTTTLTRVQSVVPRQPLANDVIFTEYYFAGGEFTMIGGYSPGEDTYCAPSLNDYEKKHNDEEFKQIKQFVKLIERNTTWSGTIKFIWNASIEDCKEHKPLHKP